MNHKFSNLTVSLTVLLNLGLCLFGCGSSPDGEEMEDIIVEEAPVEVEAPIGGDCGPVNVAPGSQGFGEACDEDADCAAGMPCEPDADPELSCTCV